MKDSKPCPTCDGVGEIKCSECGGEGWFACECPRCFEPHESACEECNMRGGWPCEDCDSTGWVPVTDEDLEANGQLNALEAS